MLEVIPYGNGWRWRWISFCGRVLVDSYEHFTDDLECFTEGAKKYRVDFWAMADTIDHRQGRCI
jgi:hypothetical protein